MIATMLKNKLNEPSPIELKAEKWLSNLWVLIGKFWIIIRKESKKFIKYLFFYTPENKMDATLHIIEIIAWLFVGYRLSQ